MDNIKFVWNGGYLYRAWTGVGQEPERQDEAMKKLGMKWNPSIHMPKEAARLFLRVKAVRVERLQDITEDGVCKEGAEPLVACKCEHTVYYPEGGVEACWNTDCCSYCPAINESYEERFGELVWNPTIKQSALPLYGWAANPWVWVIEFEGVSREAALKVGEAK